MKLYTMKSMSGTLFILAIAAATFFASQPTQAENLLWSSEASQTQQPANQDAGRSADLQTFTGVIVKSGDKLVLTDPLTKTIYQLDDQRKAQELVNKNVKVTGVLDPSTGTIRVSAIQPI